MTDGQNGHDKHPVCWGDPNTEVEVPCDHGGTGLVIIAGDHRPYAAGIACPCHIPHVRNALEILVSMGYDGPYSGPDGPEANARRVCRQSVERLLG